MAQVQEIPLEKIIPGDNDRTVFKEDEIKELAESIARYGLAQPITVRPIPGNGHFEICLLYTSPSPRD